jgi:acyl-CoA thioester hydrolase
MSNIYEQEFFIRWSDLDPNYHMRHSAFADLCAATRFHYLESVGYNMVKFKQLQMGPILFSENLSYHKEVLANDKVRVNVLIAGYSPDGRKWKIRHQIHRMSDQQLAATIEVMGAWFSISQRKIMAPPQDLIQTMDKLPKTEDFVAL